MRIFLSKLLYYIGDLVSKLLYWDCFGWLYPLYNKLMISSSKLDKDGKVWQDINNE
jgi:hypothetical protein